MPTREERARAREERAAAMAAAAGPQPYDADAVRADDVEPPPPIMPGAAAVLAPTVAAALGFDEESDEDVDEPPSPIVIDIPEDQATAAFRFLTQAGKNAMAFGSRRADARFAKFKAASEEERNVMIENEINRVKDLQRDMLVQSLKGVTHACWGEDLKSFSRQLTGRRAPLLRIGREGDENIRRGEIIRAVTVLQGGLWPVDLFGNPKRCAHDTVLLVGGADMYQAYMQKCGRLRVAQAELFSGGEVCGVMDTALLCVSHQQMRESRLCSSYIMFDFHAEPFIGSMVDGGQAFVQRFCQTRYSATNPMPRHEKLEPGFSDEFGRVARGRFLRIVELMLLQKTELGWDDVQGSFNALIPGFLRSYRVDGLPVTNINPEDGVTGDWLCERYDGEIAAELVAIQWRILHNDPGWGSGTNNMPKLPLWADVNEVGTETWNVEFMSGIATDRASIDRDFGREIARAYVRRLMYTAASTSWFLHSPLSVALIMSIERDVAGRPLNTISQLGSYATIYNGEDGSPAKVFGDMIRAHRDTGLRIGDGRAEAQSYNVTLIVSQRLRRNMPKLPCGSAYRAVSVQQMGIDFFRRHPKAVIGGVVGTVVITAAGLYFLAGPAAAGIAAEGAYQTAAATGAAEATVLNNASATVGGIAAGIGAPATNAVRVYNTHQWAMASLWNGQCRITSNVFAAAAAAAVAQGGATPGAQGAAAATAYDASMLTCWDVSQGPAPRYSVVGRTAPNPAAPAPPSPPAERLRTASFLEGLESLNANEVIDTITQAESTALDGATPQGSGINRMGAQAQDSAGYSTIGHELQFGDARNDEPPPLDDATAADALSEDNARANMALKKGRKFDFDAAATKLQTRYNLRARPKGSSSMGARLAVTKLTMEDQNLELLGRGSRPLRTYTRKQPTIAYSATSVKEDPATKDFFMMVERRWKGF